MEAAPLFQDIEGVPAGGEAVFVTASDGTRIRVGFWGGGERTALIFPGRTEYIERYGHVVSQLQEQNFNVVVIDWRGQGLSDRHDNRTDRGYVGTYSDFQLDIEAVFSVPQIAALPSPRVLLAHSMGGLIALRALFEKRIDVKAAIFSAPMWGLPNVPALAPLLNVLDTAGKPFGIDTALVPGYKQGYYPLYQPYEGNSLTSDAAQYARIGDQLRAHPELGLGGPTIHWARESAIEMKAMRDVAVPDIPMLVFVGSDETVVDAKVIRARVQTLPDARLHVIKGSRHEVFMESPEIRQQVWETTTQFLDATLKNPA